MPSKIASKEKPSDSNFCVPSWDTAISDAESELATVNSRRVQLQQALRIFRANKRDGVSWPEPKGTP